MTGRQPMSRYQFTTSDGHAVCTVEAATAADAAAVARSRTGRTGLLCSHLSDEHSMQPTEAIFFYGPDAVGG